MKATGGRWRPSDRYRYFLAGAPGAMEEVVALGGKCNLLIAVDLGGREGAPYGLPWVNALVEAGHSILIDSGVYTLAMDEVRRSGSHMDEVRSRPVDQIAGYDKLVRRYLAFVEPLKDLVWGYIEIDWGGAESKTEIRRGLEARGLSPIPVYHPLNDGWDYFDFLASNYDRICVANLAHADVRTKGHLLYTISERARAYPGLWVHALGVTPNQLCYAYGIQSYDSTSWTFPARWGALTSRAFGQGAGTVLLRYGDLGSNSDEAYKAAWGLSGYAAVTDSLAWGQYVERIDRLQKGERGE